MPSKLAAWQVLTNDERLPEFVPDLFLVQGLSRNGNVLRIEQTSVAGFLFMSHTIRMVLQIEEVPYSEPVQCLFGAKKTLNRLSTIDGRRRTD